MEIRVLTSSSVHSRGLDDFIASQMICEKSMMGSNFGEQEAANLGRENRRADDGAVIGSSSLFGGMSDSAPHTKEAANSGGLT